jgi:hypothetical protein
MRKLVSSLLGYVGLAIVLPVCAATFIPVIPVSGSASNAIYAINDKNEITGAYSDSQGVTHGFAGSLNGDYQTFDAGSTNTNTGGIDKKGDIVGTIFDSSSTCKDSAFERDAKGNIQLIKKDNMAISGTAGGMAASGDFVGVYCDGSGNARPFVGKKAQYKKDITLSGTHQDVFPSSIDSAGDIVGFVDDPDGQTRGFLLKDGITTEIAHPGTGRTELLGINDHGQATGLYIDGFSPHAFVYDIATAKFTNIDPPNSSGASAWGINNAGLVTINADNGRYVYCPKKKSKCPTNGAP